MTYTIGFIGLGTMGLPMATHLQNRGHSLKLYARRAEVFAQEAKPLIDAGAIPCLSLAEVATDVDLIITNVLGTADVQELLIDGPDAVIHHAKSGTCIIDHSTIDPSATATMAATLAKAGLEMVDAPVSGGVWAAQGGTLVAMIGGSDRACQRAMEVIDAYTKQVTCVGTSGHGQIAKLCNQIAQVITIEGVAESLSFAKALGADPAKVFAAIEGGMGGSPMMTLMGPKMIAADYQAGIAARLHAKDAGIAAEASRSHDLNLPCLEVVHQQYQRLMADGLGDHDSSMLIEMLKR